MRDIHHRLKLRRGSSPQKETRDGFVHWVRGLQSNEEKGAISAPAERSDEERRWQDDGGSAN